MPDASLRQIAQTRIIAPVRPSLRRASGLAVCAGLIWPFQAAALAWAVAGWVEGAPALPRAMLAAAVFLLGAALRAWLEMAAGRCLFEAADQTIARERAALIAREPKDRAAVGSAAIAALMVQKLPLMQPWITRYYVAMVRVSVLPAVLLGLAFALSWPVGLTLLLAGPLIPLFMALVGIAADRASHRQMEEIGTLNTMLMDRLSALLDIRALGAVARASADFAARSDALRERTMAVLRIAFLSSTVLELFAALGVAMVAVFVGFSLLGEISFGSWGTPLTLAEGLFLLLIAPEYFQPLRDLAAAWHDRAAGYAVVTELEALDQAERAGIIGTGAPAQPLSGALSLRTQGAVVALSGTRVALPDFTVSAGETLALVGPSGVGKSTALAALAGLVPLAQGEIHVCGRPLSKVADPWRARLALVPQRVHFPDEPLARWLGEGDPWAALAAADADEIIRRLPRGLDTRLGETGGGVSGGEARRLMLARALVTGADLILADEPTADLDAETAARITAALTGIARSGTSVLVATHDPALSAAMDRQIEMAE